jgi:hypothetical protein
MRLAGIAWRLAALVAGLLAGLLLGIGERPEERWLGLALALGALAAGAIGIRIRAQPSPMVARWSVLAALAWVVAATLFAPADLHEDDRDTLLWLPAVLPVLGGLASLHRIGPARPPGG